jgi:hypothetical protein
MMSGFHSIAYNKIQGLNQSYERLKEYAGETAVYFGENDDMEWEQLFALFLNLFVQIEKAIQLNHKLVIQKQKLLKKQIREEQKRKRRKGGKNKNKKGDENEIEPVNILEEIKLRAAKGTLKPKSKK